MLAIADRGARPGMPCSPSDPHLALNAARDLLAGLDRLTVAVLHRRTQPQCRGNRLPVIPGSYWPQRQHRMGSASPPRRERVYFETSLRTAAR